MTLRPFTAFFAAFALHFASPAAAQLSSAEQAMVRTVDAEQERTVAMLGKWVDQNSGTLNSPGV
ncbi:MAG: M20 family peptidase, partial [Sphingomonas sp.]|nr:M20 family peptidase [Sphingomonas sp.]